MRIPYSTFGIVGWGLLASSAFAQSPATTTTPVPPATTQAEPAERTAEQIAQTEIVSNLPKNISLFDFTYGEPGSPVLPLVGVQSDQITRVESVRRFGISVLTGIASNEAAPAIGIDFSPFWLMARGPISLEQYRLFTPLQRVFARTKVAAAASRGNEANAIPSSLVFSLSSRLLTSQDPLMDGTFVNCVAAEPGDLGRLLASVEDAGFAASDNSPDNTADEDYRAAADARMTQVQTQIDAAYKVCADRLATALSRRPSFDVGAGFRLTGTPGRFRELQGSGVVVWGTFATGVFGGGADAGGAFSNAIGMQARGVIHARYTLSEDIFDTNGVRTGQADSGLLVAGLESVPVQGRPERLRWSVQAGWTRQDAPNAMTEDRNYWRFLGIANYRVSEGMWLNATVGRVQGRGVESDTYISIGISLTPSTGSAGIDNFYRRTR